MRSKLLDMHCNKRFFSDTWYGMVVGIRHHRVGLGLAAIEVLAVAAWRIQGVFRWYRDIEKEMEQLKREAEAATPARKCAV